MSQEIKRFACFDGHARIEYEVSPWGGSTICPVCDLQAKLDDHRARLEMLEREMNQAKIDKDAVERAERLLGDAERVEKAV